MDLFPAIDLRGGRCVRLYQGDYGRETVYGDDPVAQARSFADAGAPWVHVVDLDAARTGDPVNRPVVAAVAAALAGTAPPAAIAGGAAASGAVAGGAASSAAVAGGAASSAAVAGGASPDALAGGASSAAPAGAASSGALGADPAPSGGADGSASAARATPVQSGGGVRDDAAADALFAAGVTRVVVGTAALERPDWVRSLAARYPGGVAVGLDARGRDVAVRGWVEGSGQDLVDVARRFEDAGVAALVVTEIGRDGTLAGPDLDQLASVLEATAVDVVASGGVGTLDDLRALAGLSAGRRRLAGAIVGRALYEGAFTLTEALAASASATPAEGAR